MRSLHKENSLLKQSSLKTPEETEKDLREAVIKEKIKAYDSMIGKK